VLWNLLLGLFFLGAARYGDYISDECPQRKYTCPKICDVDHKHFPREECENKKTKGDIMPDPKTCIEAGLKEGTKEYEDCLDYKGKWKTQVKKDKNANPPIEY
jgi:hypothetical protein